MSQQRVVQLSSSSLALVFCRDEESSRAGGGKYNTNNPASGQEIFADFKAQNQRSFWNKRLVKAVAEVYFQGWMENLVLFVHGNANNLEVLREAWMRRALRSPKGFVIKAVGDLSPVQMSPVPQSQFIPLAEVLCSVISDMNSAHVTVNQEALINHMSKAHPGMTIPTQDILYNALGSLIKERKIYHTGEGYFIVTPQTYFITNSLVREKSWWTSGGDNEPPPPPPITYLLSNEACTETHAAGAPLVAHCRSCSCFAPPQPCSGSVAAPPAAAVPVPPSVPDQQSVSVSVSECTGKSLKWPRPSDHKPSVQNQSTSTAADYQASEVSKTTAASAAAGRRDKDGKDKPGRRFGLSLFRRNGGKKEKPRKEYASFSAQFPPEEWPVRDEDDLNNLPRDLEHAIIRRINPELTVDNLTRHTVLMKRLEERGVAEREQGPERALDRADGGVDKGMSTEILASPRPRRRHSYRAGPAAGRRSAPKASRTKRRVHSSREKQRDRERGKSKAPARADDDPDMEDLIPSRLGPQVPADEPGRHQETAEGKCLYKKRIDNPFQAASAKEPASGTAATAGAAAKDQTRRDGEKDGKAGAGRRERTGHRSKSWDPHRAIAAAADTEPPGKSRLSEDRPYDPPPLVLLHHRQPEPPPGRELPADYGTAYPQSSTLRMDDKVRRQREVKSRVREEGRAVWEREGKPSVPQEGEHGGGADHRRPPASPTREDVRPVARPFTDTDAGLPARSHDPAAALVRQRLSLSHADAQGGRRSDLLSSHQRPYTTTAGQQGAANGGGREPRSPGQGDRQELIAESIEGLIVDNHRLYQREEEEEEEEEEEDACSSLYLSEEGGTDSREAYQTGAVYYRDPQSIYHDRDPHSQNQHLQSHYHHHPDPHALYSQPHSLQGNWDSTYVEDPPSTTTQPDPPLTSVRHGETSWSGRPAPHHHHQRTRSPGAQSEPSPRRGPLTLGERGQEASHSLGNLDRPGPADSSIFDYCQTSEVDSDAETLHKSADEGDGESAQWACEAEEEEEEEDEEEREVFQTLGERGGPQSPGPSLSMPSGTRVGEMGESGESRSITGDSGIDSPRTRVSLASNNTVILEGLKRRGFLQNLEKLHSKSTAMRPQSSLLQLTPVMNV